MAEYQPTAPYGASSPLVRISVGIDANRNLTLDIASAYVNVDVKPVTYTLSAGLI
jgi:cystathionine beta-lyase/cystathionine gamma-synthase